MCDWCIDHCHSHEMGVSSCDATTSQRISIQASQDLAATTIEDVCLFRILLSRSCLCKFDCHLGGAVTHVTSITELVKNDYLVLDKPMVDKFPLE